MNQVQIMSRSESAAMSGAELSQNATTSSCCCGSGATKIDIERGEKMVKNMTNDNQTTTVTAPEIVCGGCASSIKKALGNVEGVAEVDVDVATKKVTVNHSETVSREKIVDALDRAGYSVA